MRHLLILFVPGLALAAPIQLTHQARLLDGQGAPVNGDVDVTVGLWSAAEGGTDVWSDQFENVEVRDGYFSVRLGSGLPLDSSDLLGGSRYVQLTVDAVPMGERTLLVEVPYAAVARSVVLGAPGNCDSTVAGSLAWVASAGELQVCDGEAWLTAFSSADTEPEPLDVAPATGVALGVVAASAPVALAGVTEEVLLTVAGDGSPEIRAAGGPWGAAVWANDGDPIEVRLTAPEDGGVTRTATVSAGSGTVGTFDVTTSEATSCDVLFTDGNDSDGDYLIDVDGGGGTATRSVPCDMDRDGAGWAVYDAGNIQLSDWDSIDPGAITESAVSFQCDQQGSCTNVFPLPYDVSEWRANVQVGDSTGSTCARARWTGRMTVGDAVAYFGRTSSSHSNSNLQLFGIDSSPSPQFDQSRKRFEVHWTEGVGMTALLTDIDGGTTWAHSEPNSTSTDGGALELQWTSNDTRCGSWRGADRHLVIDELAFR